MIPVLAIVLCVLFLVIGRGRGVRSLQALAINIGIFFMDIGLFSLYVNPYLICVITCGLMIAVILFFQNGVNIKTSAAAVSVFIVVVILMLFSCLVSSWMHLGSLNELIIYEDDVASLDVNVAMNFGAIASSLMVIAILGSVTDVAISVTSSVYEIATNTVADTNEIFHTGKRVGKTIFSTTVNTFFFACIGESMFLIMMLKAYDYSFGELINSAAFVELVMPILLSGIGCILVMPLSSFIVTFAIEYRTKKNALLKYRSGIPMRELRIHGNTRKTIKKEKIKKPEK